MLTNPINSAMNRIASSQPTRSAIEAANKLIIVATWVFSSCSEVFVAIFAANPSGFYPALCLNQVLQRLSQ
jgi:hypothetical protein